MAAALQRIRKAWLQPPQSALPTQPDATIVFRLHCLTFLSGRAHPMLGFPSASPHTVSGTNHGS